MSSMLMFSFNWGEVTRRSACERDQVGDVGSVARWLRAEEYRWIQESRSVMNQKSTEEQGF